jgi:hypothetical protein
MNNSLPKDLDIYFVDFREKVFDKAVEGFI